jgi:hypothetical protein
VAQLLLAPLLTLLELLLLLLLLLLLHLLPPQQLRRHGLLLGWRLRLGCECVRLLLHRQLLLDER